MARRQVAGGTFGGGMNLSDSSTSGTKWWLIHHQSFNGLYERKNIYSAAVSGATGGAPYVESNFLDITLTVTTTDELIYGDFSAGNFNQYQDIVMTNNSPSGGFGLSGTISTSSIGILRRPAILVGGEPSETTGTCSETFSGQLDQTPGTFDEGGYDTSSDVQPLVFQLLKSCKVKCPTFETFLVNI